MLWKMYQSQRGSIASRQIFDTERGVRQGDGHDLCKVGAITCRHVWLVTLHPLVWKLNVSEKMTNQCLKEPCFAGEAGELIVILWDEKHYKYILRGNRCDWFDFAKKCQIWSLPSRCLGEIPKSTNTVLLFDSVVSPPATFGTASVLLAKTKIQKWCCAATDAIFQCWLGTH